MREMSNCSYLLCVCVFAFVCFVCCSVFFFFFFFLCVCEFFVFLWSLLVGLKRETERKSQDQCVKCRTAGICCVCVFAFVCFVCFPRFCVCVWVCELFVLFSLESTCRS